MTTQPGVHSKAKLDRFDREEVSIINCLARSFYITYTESIEKGSAVYKYALARPCDDIRHVLNYDREVVILFSQYNNFEARSLDAYRDIENSLSEIRLERAVRFLFSRDDQIAQKIERFLRSEPEYPTVCAFNYADTRLFSTQANISQHLRKVFYSRDIFNFHSPLRTDHFFFGRNDLMKSIIDRHISGESTGVFGLRRTGKTSLIHALNRIARASRQPLIHIDCQTTEVHLKRWYALIEFICLKICSEYSIKKPSAIAFTSENAAENLRKTLVELTKKLGAGLLIAFDEVENISPNTSPTSHWQHESDALLFWQP